MTAPGADIEKLTAEQILLIDDKMPEKLFPRDAEEVTRIYRVLAKKWFPDLNRDPKATAVFEHLTKLRETAKEKLANSSWQEPGVFTCRLKDYTGAGL